MPTWVRGSVVPLLCARFQTDTSRTRGDSLPMRASIMRPLSCSWSRHQVFASANLALHLETSVDKDFRTVNEAGSFAGQKGDDVGDLFGLPDSPKRASLSESPDLAFVMLGV
jgi:hypothetical protein